MTGTKKARQKIKPVWRGPFQILEIVSENVYLVQDLREGKPFEVHSALMWFYEGPGFKPSELVKELSAQDDGGFEISKLDKFRLHRNEYEVLVHWRGFEQPTWEPVETIYQCAPEAMITRLSKPKSKLESQVKAHLGLASLKVSRVAQDGQEMPVTRQVIFPNEAIRQNYVGEWTWFFPCHQRTGWTKEEDQVLQLCVEKYGIRSVSFFQSYLPNKRKTQIYSKIQRTYGIMCLTVIAGLRLSGSRVREMLQSEDFPHHLVKDRQLTGWTTEESTAIRKLYAECETAAAPEDIEIPSLGEPMSGKDSVVMTSMENPVVGSTMQLWSDYERYQGSMTALPSEVEQAKEEEWVRSPSREMDLRILAKCLDPKLKVQCWFQRSEMGNVLGTSISQPTLKAKRYYIWLRVGYKGDGPYWLQFLGFNMLKLCQDPSQSEGNAFIARIPWNARAISGDLRQEKVWKALRPIQDQFRVIYADPPWDAPGGCSPVRGTGILYPTMTTQE